MDEEINIKKEWRGNRFWDIMSFISTSNHVSSFI